MNRFQTVFTISACAPTQRQRRILHVGDIEGHVAAASAAAVAAAVDVVVAAVRVQRRAGPLYGRVLHTCLTSMLDEGVTDCGVLTDSAST